MHKDDFGVELILPDPLVPIGTYEIRDEEEHRVIPGIIFLADIVDEVGVARKYSQQKYSEIMWLDPAMFQPGQDQCVPDFEATIVKAVEARKRIGTVQK